MIAEFEVETEDIAVSDTDPSSTQGTEDVSTDQQVGDSDSLENYQLARDRARRQNIKKPSGYADAAMLFYALYVADEVEYLSQPLTRKQLRARKLISGCWL